MIAFSTCWNSHRHDNGEHIFHEIIKMGFTSIEVSHGLNLHKLPGIVDFYHRKRNFKLTVTGVHNFCPSPVEVMIDAPDAYEYTSDSAFDRKRAVDLTIRTLETAEQLEAGYVVLHLGSVKMEGISKELEEMAKNGKIHSREYVKRKLKMVELREKLGPNFVQRSREALDEILPHARKVGIPLAIESRSSYEQVPDEREMEALMEEYVDEPLIGYWHDFGHVQRKNNLGLLDHFEWLSQMKDHLIGCHVHDVDWPVRDHRVPMATGDVDLDSLLPLVGKEKPLVWELSPGRGRWQIEWALEEWKKRYPEWM